LFNLSLDIGIHPWKDATVVILNKPNHPDYSQPKAYCPISLLECTGKLMEKIIAKRINTDIETHLLLSMSQFGSCPHHNAVDAIATLVYRIQATHSMGHAGALLLFDILGFFDSIHPSRITQILHDKGFPPNLCDWVFSFLTERRASLKLGPHLLNPFTLSTGTPQGSPLSPILSALYTSTLLSLADHWIYCDLTLYIDDGVIYTTSATTSAIHSFKQVLNWLHINSLSVNLAKSELMIFSPTRQPHLTGPKIWGTRYQHNTLQHNISTITSL